MDKTVLKELLEGLESCPGTPDAERVTDLFHYCQYLLDNDDNLTRMGNLNGAAKGLLRQRIFSLHGIEEEEPVDDRETETD